MSTIAQCVADVQKWADTMRLKLNQGKTELIWFHCRRGVDVHTNMFCVPMSDSTIYPKGVVWDLGVLLDEELTMRPFVHSIVRTCFYHLLRIRQVKTSLDGPSVQMLIQALVTSRIDYCNSILFDLPACTIRPLQLVQNAAARMVTNIDRREHVSPILRQLHWLPVAKRVVFKIAILMYKIDRKICPSYMTELVVPCSSATTRPSLRSASRGDYIPIKTRTKMGERSFSYAGPQTWNKLPSKIRDADSLSLFKRQLKSFLFDYSLIRGRL